MQKRCHKCSGTGQSAGMGMITRKCLNCDGSGYVASLPETTHSHDEIKKVYREMEVVEPEPTGIEPMPIQLTSQEAPEGLTIDVNEKLENGEPRYILVKGNQMKSKKDFKGKH